MSFEGMPMRAKPEEGKEKALSPFESARRDMEQDARAHELSVLADGLRAREAIAGLPGGSERDALMGRTSAATHEAHANLRKALSAAVVALALNATPASALTESGQEHASAMATALAEDPDLTETLLQGVLAAAKERPDIPESFVQETNEALAKLQEPQENRYGKLAARTAENLCRLFVAAIGFGITLPLYDIFKDIAKTVRSKDS